MSDLVGDAYRAPFSALTGVREYRYRNAARRRLTVRTYIAV
jgi:hypothetical protein